MSSVKTDIKDKVAPASSKNNPEKTMPEVQPSKEEAPQTIKTAVKQKSKSEANDKQNGLQLEQQGSQKQSNDQPAPQTVKEATKTEDNTQVKEVTDIQMKVDEDQEASAKQVPGKHAIGAALKEGKDGSKTDGNDKIQTRSRAPSNNLGNHTLEKKKSQHEEQSQNQDDVQMQEQVQELQSKQSDDPRTRKSQKKVKPRNPMPVLVKKNKPKVVPYQRKQINTNGIRLDKLSFGTLRRYQYFFGLDKVPDKPFISDREQLLECVEEHFSSQLQVNPVEIIYRFLSTKKDPDQSLQENYYTRNQARTRIARNENQ